MTKKKKGKPIDVGPMVYGNGLTHILRIAYENGDLRACMRILPYHSCHLVLGVCEKNLDIEGDDRKGFYFVARNEEGEEILRREDEHNGDRNAE